MSDFATLADCEVCVFANVWGLLGEDDVLLRDAEFGELIGDSLSERLRQRYF